MNSHLTLAVQVLYGLAALNAAFALTLYGLKLKNIRARRASEKFDRRFRDYLVYIQTNLDGDERLRAPPGKLSRAEKRLLQEKLVDMIEAFADEQREKLIALCGRLGFIRSHLRRLKSRSYRRRIDAAYYLGCMRVREAAPAVMSMLRGHRLNSSYFVVARAAAKCARDERDVRELVDLLISKGKRFSELIADLIEESGIDHTSLFIELLGRENPAFVRIGLTGLRDYTNPAAAAAVYRCIDAEDEDIQRKAIEIYLRSAAMLPRNVVGRLLEHDSADIRFMTVRALSEQGNPIYAGVLRKALLDADARVVNAGADGLLRMGLEGVTVFCETAKEAREQGRGSALQDRIEEELASLSERLDQLDVLARYNALHYAYDKTFGKNKRIYRVV